MKQCRWMRKRLPLYVGGELSGLESWIVRCHLRHCRLCQEEADTLSAVSDAAVRVLRREREQLVHKDIWHEIIYRLPRERQSSVVDHQSLWRGRRWQLLAAAGLTATAALLLFIFKIHRLPEHMDLPDESIQVSLPTVEEVYTPNTTVMTIETGDPKLKIVWLFQKDLTTEKSL